MNITIGRVFALTDEDIVLRPTNSNFNLVMLTIINHRWRFDFITALFFKIKNINDSGMLMSVVTLSTDIHSSLGCGHTFWTIVLINDLYFFWYILVLPSYPPRVWKHFPLTTFEPNRLGCPEMCWTWLHLPKEILVAEEGHVRTVIFCMNRWINVKLDLNDSHYCHKGKEW